MFVVAFTLGLFGSLHCLGMCGPIALGFSRIGENSKLIIFSNALKYNLGRIFTYALLGLTLGLIGQVILVSGFQKLISIAAGVLFIILFTLSMDIEQFLFKSGKMKAMLKKYNTLVAAVMTQRMYRKSFFLGIINGLIPCGLVYIALAGALLESDIYSSILFMTFFGLGTLPMMGMISIGGGFINVSLKSKLKKVVPYLQLAIGIWFLYRGIAIDHPLDIDFYLSLQEGPICH